MRTGNRTGGGIGRWAAVGGACATLLLALAVTGARTNCVPIDPEEPVCEGENPEGCRNSGCAEGEVCALTSGRCVPSSCNCDETTGVWVCTEDCGGGVCVPVDERCEGENPQGCASSGCPEGQRCAPSVLAVCIPSACTCDPSTGAWVCTEDCDGGVCVADEPSSCPGENPAGCVSTGCGDGEVCARTDACVPSSCSCDAEAGAWLCTADCSGGTCVPAGDACGGPNPAGCVSTGCPAGQVCHTMTDACIPSSCFCDATTGAWACTRDCNGGICVTVE